MRDIAVNRTLSSMVFTGDSLTAPSSSSWANSTAYQLFIVPINFATSGWQATDLIVDYPIRVQPRRQKTAGAVSNLSVWVGANDVYFTSLTADQIYENIRSLWRMAKDDGFRVIAFTITPAVRLSSAQDAVRRAVNAKIIASGEYDYLCRPDVLFPDPSNASDYSDGVHLTADADSRLAMFLACKTEMIPSGEQSVLVFGYGTESPFNSPVQINGDLGLNEGAKNVVTNVRFGSDITGNAVLNFLLGDTVVMSLSKNGIYSGLPMFINNICTLGGAVINCPDGVHPVEIHGADLRIFGGYGLGLTEPSPGTGHSTTNFDGVYTGNNYPLKSRFIAQTTSVFSPTTTFQINPLLAAQGGYMTVNLSSDLSFTTINLISGIKLVIRLVCDSTSRNLTFPSGWTFLGSAVPTAIAPNKTAILELDSFGNTNAEVTAVYTVQP